MKACTAPLQSWLSPFLVCVITNDDEADLCRAQQAFMLIYANNHR